MNGQAPGAIHSFFPHTAVFLSFFPSLLTFSSLSLSLFQEETKQKKKPKKKKKTHGNMASTFHFPTPRAWLLPSNSKLFRLSTRERERKVCINVCAYKYSDWVLSVYLHASGHPSKRRAAPHGATRRTILLKLCWRCFELVYQKPLLLFSFLSSRLSTQVWTIPEPLLLLLLLLLWGRIILLAISLPTFITLLF